MILVAASASAQTPGRKYTSQELLLIKRIFNTETHDHEACAIRLYSYGSVNVVVGAAHPMITATVAYVGADGKLTNQMAEYIIPTDSGGSPAAPYNDGNTFGIFSGKDKTLKYSFASVPSALNIVESWKNKGQHGLSILDNWRQRPDGPPADLGLQCGPKARFCECIYDFPH